MLSTTVFAAVLSAFVPQARAQNLIGEVGAPVEVGTSGAWARALATDRGWYMGVGTAGDFYVGKLTQNGDSLVDWSFDRSDWVKSHSLATSRTTPSISVRRTWLHVSSANNIDPNDSAYAWRLSADFEILASGVVEENEPRRAHNDMATICSPHLQGAVFSTFSSGPPEATFFRVDETANTESTVDLGEIQVEGGAFLDDAPTERIILISATYRPAAVRHLRLRPQPHHPDAGRRSPVKRACLWPQRIIRVGQYYVVAMMSMVDSGPGSSDTGDVWLHVFDEEFNLLEQTKLTNYGSGRDSAMRPWMERIDDLLIVSYDILTTHTFVAVKLNLDGVEAVDTGFTPPEGDEGGDGSDEPPSRPSYQQERLRCGRQPGGRPAARTRNAGPSAAGLSAGGCRRDRRVSATCPNHRPKVTSAVCDDSDVAVPAFAV